MNGTSLNYDINSVNLRPVTLTLFRLSFISHRLKGIIKNRRDKKIRLVESSKSSISVIKSPRVALLLFHTFGFLCVKSLDIGVTCFVIV